MTDVVLALTTSFKEENHILATTNLESKKPMTLSERLNYLSRTFLHEKEKLEEKWNLKKYGMIVLCITKTHHLTQEGNYKLRLKANQQQTQEL